MSSATQVNWKTIKPVLLGSTTQQTRTATLKRTKMPQPITIIVPLLEGFLDDSDHPIRVFTGHLDRQQIKQLAHEYSHGYAQTAIMEVYYEGELVNTYFTYNNKLGIAPETINNETLKGAQFTEEHEGFGDLTVSVRFTSLDQPTPPNHPMQTLHVIRNLLKIQTTVTLSQISNITKKTPKQTLDIIIAAKEFTGIGNRKMPLLEFNAKGQITKVNDYAQPAEAYWSAIEPETN